MNDEDLMWKNVEAKHLLDARIFTVEEMRRSDSRGREARFVRLNSPDWVTIIPEMEESGKTSFLIVRQFRHGSGRISLEFPAGVVEEGESPRDAAHRELLEETGYSATGMREIGSVNPNPAFMGNNTVTFLATGLVKSSRQNLDEHELVDFHSVNYKELTAAIGRFPYDNAIMVQAWFWYLRGSGRI